MHFLDFKSTFNLTAKESFGNLMKFFALYSNWNNFKFWNEAELILLYSSYRSAKKREGNVKKSQSYCRLPVAKKHTFSEICVLESANVFTANQRSLSYAQSDVFLFGRLSIKFSRINRMEASRERFKLFCVNHCED